MKILTLHVDYIEWKGLKKALKSMEDLPPKEIAKKRVEEALVVLTAVEKGDSVGVLGDYIRNIKEISGKVGTKRIVLYPYAHLSSNLGSSGTAVKIFKGAEEGLIKEGYEVSRAPFGYYKTFELKVKGHPLSELSREIIVKGNEISDLPKDEIKKLLYEISKSKLDTSKITENDHRIIGKKMNLWSFNSVAPGMVFWHDKGLHIKNKLIEYWREKHRIGGYEEISTPQIMDRKLWEISGHWSKYGENNFRTLYEKRDFIVKPMNCPGGMLVYNSSPKSYKDLPLRVGEMGIVHRVELSGVLSGLFRVIQFTQDDAHLFCVDEKQTKDEIFSLIELIKEFYHDFKLDFDHVELSTRPEKRIGEDHLWDMAEKLLEESLKDKKIEYKINEGEGAFYGPKIDFHIKDSLGRAWQTSTIQLDFALPERFNLIYKDEKGSEKKPIMIHRVIYGSLERFIGILTEHLNGNFPLWISPNQIKVLTINEGVKEYARKVYDKFFKEGFKVEFDCRNETINKKVREASIERFNYIITVGDKEESSQTLSVRSRDGGLEHGVELSKFISRIKKEVKKRK
ncbi:threonine--tRNA ligase [Candidatus Pacearchaeota archaeon]|nr:threonine--tRNA ligase [Candidatus Pacearchaeota archaeon]